jgi:two-component system KDP operon response regulator KdpE
MPDTYSILIVEDDSGMTSYLKRLLRPMTLKLTTAGSGRQAIQYLSQNTVDLVLLDIGLPDMDGYQVMDHIYKKLPQTLVIVMTGDVTIESAVKIA